MAGLITMVPEKVPGAVADRQDFQISDRGHLPGWPGLRIAANASNRLAKIDTARLWKGTRSGPVVSRGTASTSANGCPPPRWRGLARATQRCARNCRRSACE